MDNFSAIIEEFQKMEVRIRDQVLSEIGKKFPKEETKIWLNKTETAKYLGVSFKTLQNFIKENPSFPSSNISGAIRFNIHHVDEWMQLHREVMENRKVK